LRLFQSVNIFYHVNQEDSDPTTRDPERAKQEKEFKIGATGFAESFGVLLASLVAMPVELELCKTQVRRGKLLCKSIDDTRS
jgi:battenin